MRIDVGQVRTQAGRTAPCAWRALPLLAALALSIAACGSDDEGAGGETAAASSGDGGGAAEETAAPEVDFEPVTIENCGRSTTYEAPPERAVPLDQNVTEMMLALGLEDRVAGFARQHFSSAKPVLTEYAAAYDELELLADKAPSKEVFLGVDPDFALTPFGFSEESGLSQESLEADGIPTYMLEDQCEGRTEPVSFDDLYGSVRDLGAIFGVKERADELVRELEATAAEVADAVESDEPVSVFVYDSGEDAPFTVGGLGMSNAIIEAAGGENIFADLEDQFVDASWEAVIAADPDVILIMDYFHGADGETVDSKRAVVESRLGEGAAVREDRVISMQLTGFFQSVRNPAVAQELAGLLHP